MELFATDRVRPVSLLETDSALEPDFEALGVHADATAEEPLPEQRPKYITTSIGSTRRKRSMANPSRRVLRVKDRPQSKAKDGFSKRSHAANDACED